MRLTGRLQQLLPSFLPSILGLGTAAAVDKIVVDNERHILYMLLQPSGTIQASTLENKIPCKADIRPWLAKFSVFLDHFEFCQLCEGYQTTIQIYLGMLRRLAAKCKSTCMQKTSRAPHRPQISFAVYLCMQVFDLGSNGGDPVKKVAELNDFYQVGDSKQCFITV